MQDLIIEVLISGTGIGAVYVMMGVGMALVYGISRIFNFAYGSFFTWSAYLAWLLFTYVSGMNYVLVFLIVIPVMFLIGVLTEETIIRPLRWKENWDNTTMMVTLGLALLLDNLALLAFGSRRRALPNIFEGDVEIGTHVISVHDIVVLIFAVSVMIFLGLFLKKTRYGMAMRAVSQDDTGAKIVGIRINRVFAVTFGISAALVGTSGILLSPKYFISPFGGWIILVKGWVITAFGGMGSLKGALCAAFILGIIEAAVGYGVGYMWVIVFWFTVLLGVLFIKPSGLFGSWG